MIARPGRHHEHVVLLVLTNPIKHFVRAEDSVNLPHSPGEAGIGYWVWVSLIDHMRMHA